MTGPGPSGGKPPGWRRLSRAIPPAPRDEADEELAFHLDMRVKDYMARGMSAEEAQAAAEERLGDLDHVREEVGRVANRNARTERRRARVVDIRQDVRYGLRVLLRSPSFTAMAVLTLALGIGATTAIFSLVHAVLLAPLPYPAPDRLVRVWEISPQGQTANPVSSGNAADWGERVTSFQALGAHQWTSPVTVLDEGEATRINIAQVQPQVFDVLQVPAALGRTLEAEDADAGNTTVLAHAMWQERYGGDPAILGRRLTLNDRDFTVVGVMLPGFSFPDEGVDLWIPRTNASFDPAERTSHNYQVIARLSPGATVASAQSELDAVVAGITEEYPAEMTGWGARIVPLHEDITAGVAPLLWVLMGGVVVVLIIACANLANLLLARAVARQKEMAVRGALGASRGRVLGQLLIESALLAAVGGAGAMLVAPLLIRVLVSAAPPGTPLLAGVGMDLRMLGFAAATALGCSVAFGLVPSLRLSRTSFESALRSGRDASPGGQNRIRSLLLVTQVGLTVLLLVGAGLFVRSFRALSSTDVGFDPDHLVLMGVELPSSRYPDTPTHNAFYEQLLEAVGALPGVVGVAATSQAPGSLGQMTFSFAIDGRVATNPSGREDDEPLHAVGGDYFRVLGRRIVEGRAFDAGDRADAAPVVIINESLARKHWPQGGALGQRIAFRVDETPWREIVGVVEDARLGSPDVPSGPALYIPYAQKRWEWLAWNSILVRTAARADPAATLAAMRETLLGLDGDLPPQSAGTVAEAFRRNTARRTFAMTLVSGFGILALVLSVVGLYGLISYSVAQQRREIGVRIALGARSRGLVQRVLGRSLGLTLAGAAAGVAAALLATRVLEALLFGVSPTDPATYLATVALIVGVALVTSWIPAYRAATTDPTTALRVE